MAMALAPAWSASAATDEFQPWTTKSQEHAQFSDQPSESLHVAWDTHSNDTAYTHYANEATLYPLRDVAYTASTPLMNSDIPFFTYSQDCGSRGVDMQYQLPATPMTDHGEWVPYYDESGEPDAMYGVMEEDIFAYAPISTPGDMQVASSTLSHDQSRRPVTSDAIASYATYNQGAMLDSRSMTFSPMPYEPAHQVRRVTSHGHFATAPPAPPRPQAREPGPGLGLGIVMPGTTYWQNELSSRRYHEESAERGLHPRSHATPASTSTFVIPRQESNVSASTSSVLGSARLPKDVQPIVRMDAVPKVSRTLTYGDSTPRSHAMATPTREPISVRRHQRQSQAKVLKTFTLPASPVSISSSPVPGYGDHGGSLTGEPLRRRHSSIGSMSAPTTPTLSRSHSRQSYFMDIDPQAEPAHAQVRTPKSPVELAVMPPLREETPSDTSAMSVGHSRVSTPSRRHSEGDSVTQLKPLKFVFEPLMFENRKSSCKVVSGMSKPLAGEDADPANAEGSDDLSTSKRSGPEIDDDVGIAPSKKKMCKQTKGKSAARTLPPPPALTDSPNAAPVQSEAPKADADDEGRIWSCSVDGCSKSFKRLEHLVRHRRSHTQEKPFECDICKRPFSSAVENVEMVRGAHARVYKRITLERPSTERASRRPNRHAALCSVTWRKGDAVAVNWLNPVKGQVSVQLISQIGGPTYTIVSSIPGTSQEGYCDSGYGPRVLAPGRECGRIRFNVPAGWQELVNYTVAVTSLDDSSIAGYTDNVNIVPAANDASPGPSGTQISLVTIQAPTSTNYNSAHEASTFLGAIVLTATIIGTTDVQVVVQ
ncbi:hypothetical protein OIV83_004726 [Microbotryomycetes sp. JL201]|nr:hypothetical protein OIV83_004726 [Microbotryomycetes sp. JL201]